nr:MAG TPA: hypothetical protein [Caudoviricetes sp.]
MILSPLDSGTPGFNPRTPCGVRLAKIHGHGIDMEFQSTHSMRSATRQLEARKNGTRVSIHALHAECDARQE